MELMPRTLHEALVVVGFTALAPPTPALCDDGAAALCHPTHGDTALASSLSPQSSIAWTPKDLLSVNVPACLRSITHMAPRVVVGWLGAVCFKPGGTTFATPVLFQQPPGSKRDVSTHFFSGRWRVLNQTWTLSHSTGASPGLRKALQVPTMLPLCISTTSPDVLVPLLGRLVAITDWELQCGLGVSVGMDSTSRQKEGAAAKRGVFPHVLAVPSLACVACFESCGTPSSSFSSSFSTLAATATPHRATSDLCIRETPLRRPGEARPASADMSASACGLVSLLMGLATPAHPSDAEPPPGRLVSSRPTPGTDSATPTPGPASTPAATRSFFRRPSGVVLLTPSSLPSAARPTSVVRGSGRCRVRPASPLVHPTLTSKEQMGDSRGSLDGTPVARSSAGAVVGTEQTMFTVSQLAACDDLVSTFATRSFHVSGVVVAVGGIVHSARKGSAPVAFFLVELCATQSKDSAAVSVVFHGESSLRWHAFLCPGRSIEISDVVLSNVKSRQRHQGILLRVTSSTVLRTNMVTLPGVAPSPSATPTSATRSRSPLAPSTAQSPVRQHSSAPRSDWIHHSPQTVVEAVSQGSPCADTPATVSLGAPGDGPCRLVTYAGTVTSIKPGVYIELDGDARTRVWVTHRGDGVVGIRCGVSIVAYRVHPMMIEGRLVGLGACMNSHVRPPGMCFCAHTSHVLPLPYGWSQIQVVNLPVSSRDSSIVCPSRIHSADLLPSAALRLLSRVPLVATPWVTHVVASLHHKFGALLSLDALFARKPSTKYVCVLYDCVATQHSS